ncbi:RNA-directed DNA polymerase, eukaryota, reverse transcriptase zinc-binding domain protein [Tanacetum coccineum]
MGGNSLELGIGVRVEKPGGGVISLSLIKPENFVEDLTEKGVGLRVADSLIGNHCKDGFTPLETIQRFLGVIGSRSYSSSKGMTSSRKGGVKVGGSMSRKSSWTEVIYKLSSRLSKWKLKTLFVGGRLTLIKLVLNVIPLYHMSMFKVPKCVSNKMEALPIHGSRGALEGTSSASRNSPLLDIIQDDLWIGEDVLKSQFPRLFALESQKDISVAEKMSHSSLAFFLRCLPRGGVEEEQFSNLISCTSAFILLQIEDHWVWSLSSTSDFSVNSANSFFDDKLLPSFDTPTRWVKVIPIKINIFAWRVWQDKLPIRLNLSLTGFDIPTILCSSCNTLVESASHLFFSCLVARQVWSKVLC